MNYEINRREQDFKEAIAYSIMYGSDKYGLVDKMPIHYYRETKMTDTQQQEKYALLNRVFTPASPILEKKLFAGRQKQVTKILGAITTPSQHAILYGERGIGKTSLANVIPSFLGEITGENAIVTKVICTRDEDFKSSGVVRSLKIVQFDLESAIAYSFVCRNS